MMPMLKTYPIRTYVSEKELKWLKKKQAEGLTASGFLRKLLLDAMKKERVGS